MGAVRLVLVVRKKPRPRLVKPAMDDGVLKEETFPDSDGFQDIFRRLRSLLLTSVVKAPRLFQSVFSAFGDLYLYKLSVVLFGDCVAKWALFSQLTNWFMFFCLTRTLSNSLETVLTVVYLYDWPCMRPSSSKLPLESRKWGLIIAALTCAIRPTSAIIWVYVGLVELFVTRDRLRLVFFEVIPTGVLRFSFLSSGGDYYGTQKWHWYFTRGKSVMIFSFLPFLIAGIMQSKQWKLSGLIAWVLGLYSLLCITTFLCDS